MNFQRFDIPALFSPLYGTLRQYDIELAKLLQSVLSNLSRMFSSGVSISDNMDLQTVSVTTDAIADTEFAVAHTLRRIPTGFIVANSDKGGVVYDSGTAWTATEIFLKCTTASTAIKVLIY